MLEIQNWMEQYCGAVRAAFGDRVRYIGLQGSRGRGEAGPDSDIDVVCILDSCSLQDLETYRAAVADLARHLTGTDLGILQTAQALKAEACREDLASLSDRLLVWSGGILRRSGTAS